MSLSSLCLMVGKLPWLQLRASSTLNCCPVHVVGSPSGFQPSQNASLWRLKLCSYSGKMFSQWEASFFCERFIAHFCGLSRVCRSRSASSSSSFMHLLSPQFLPSLKLVCFHFSGVCVVLLDDVFDYGLSDISTPFDLFSQGSWIDDSQTFKPCWQ